MATPTPMKQALSQQGRTPVAAAAAATGTPAAATPPVSTPYAPAVFSPLGPRSSPQAFKRSPAHYTATMMGHTASSGGGGSGGGGGITTTAAASYDSPAAAAMGAMGLDLVEDGMGSVGGLGHGGGGGGLLAAATAAAAARSDEDERARRLQAVQGLLRQHAGKGRVSEAGLERLATSMGLECLWEEGMMVGVSGGGGDSLPQQRTLIIAGSVLALEIAVANNLVAAVTVTFPEARRIALRRVARANAVLLANLRLRPHESPLTKTLDAFAANLEQLAVLDRLSVPPPEAADDAQAAAAKTDRVDDTNPAAAAATGLNLYEAVAGLYVSLHKLYRWDRRQLAGAANDNADNADDGDDDADNDTEPDGPPALDDLALRAQCTRHGRPALNEDGRLGLAINYWTQRRLVRPAQPRTRAFAAAQETTWRLRVGCAAMGGGVAGVVYQPVRLSDQWLSDAIVQADGGGGGGGGGVDGDGDNDEEDQPVLDWLNPDNTLVLGPATASAGEGGQATEAPPPPPPQPQLPDVKFVATFDPPLAVPYSAWHQIYDMVGLVPETDGLVTFDSLSFPVQEEAGGGSGQPPHPQQQQQQQQHDPSDPRTIRCYKDVHVGDTAATVRHRHTLFIYKPVFGRVMTELPFAHPSQLVRMLPILRQYAFLATLLEKGFRARMADLVVDPAAARQPATQQTTLHQPPTVRTTITVDGAFDSFATTKAADGADADPPATSVDVVLTAHPVPRLQVVFPFRGGTADILLEIGLNGRVHVVLQNVLDADNDADADADAAGRQAGKGKGKGKGLRPQDLGRMLEVCEDLGIWSEWIRRRCA